MYTEILYGLKHSLLFRLSILPWVKYELASSCFAGLIMTPQAMILMFHCHPVACMLLEQALHNCYMLKLQNENVRVKMFRC